MQFIRSTLAAILVLSMLFFPAVASFAMKEEMQNHSLGRSQNEANRSAKKPVIQLGPRPFFLIKDMDGSELKTALEQCAGGPFYKSDFSIGHRGAALQFPEHSKESYEAAARMGAGILECDVTFTKDKELVCRHSQCDLHTTTNILATELAEKCAVPPDFLSKKPFANVKCCTTDITLAEFKTLSAKMDAGNPNAQTIEEYMDATPDWRTDLYSANATVMSHAESIELFKQLGVKMIPELKAASVKMPFDGLTQQAYAQKMIDEYKVARVKPKDVYVQSVNLDDIRYWVANELQFGKQVVFLESVRNVDELSAAIVRLDTLVAAGIKIVAPPIWALVTLNEFNEIVPSEYAVLAKAAGLDVITWTLERSGLLKDGGGWYYQTVSDAINNDGDLLILLDVLAKDIGIVGVFSDWPAAVTYYANCMNLN